MKLFKVNVAVLVDAETEEEAVAAVSSSIAGVVVNQLTSVVEWDVEYPDNKGDDFMPRHVEIIDATPRTTEEEE